MKNLLTALLLIFFSTSSNSQEIQVQNLQPNEVPPPVIIIPEPNLKPMELTKLDVDVRIQNDLAETTTTMTFYNPNARVLAGDLYFPLPEGALISGYALDINGRMVDGSVVKKHKARQVFEKEVRKGIDPGLVEYTKGNNYKTRVFPIPAKGNRTVMIKYISDIQYDVKVPNYILPLNFKKPLKHFDLRVEVIKPEDTPNIMQGNLANFSFKKWNDSFVAETNLRDTSLTEDIIIALPEIDKKPVVVEQAADGEYFFYIKSPTEKSHIRQRQIAPKSISIIWDASGSRANAKHKRELKILKEYLKFYTKHENININVYTLRNKLSEEKTFNITSKNIAPLISYLENIRYDGGTQIGAIDEDIIKKADLYLMFTDGLSNFGEEKAGKLSVPTYIISGDSSTNHPYLNYLASKTGGIYFNLARTSDEEVANSIGISPYSFIKYTANKGKVEDAYPSTASVVDEKFSFVGKLKSKEAKITLHYGLAGDTLTKKTFIVDRDDAVRGNMLRTYWAQQKVNELLIYEPNNEEEFVKLGKEYGLVTPVTSIIVLETLEQYVEHEVVPPSSLPEMQIAYDEIMSKKQKQATKEKEDKIERMVQLWDKRVEWWNTEFDNNYKHHISQKREEANSRSGGFLEGIASLFGGGEIEQTFNYAPEESRILEREVTVSDYDGISPEQKMKADKSSSIQDTGGKITIKAWDPDTPYLKKLKSTKPKNRVDVYFEQRKEYSSSPAFYLDCAEFFYRENNRDMALQVLSNITELELENPALIRVAGYKLKQVGELKLSRMLFEEVLKLRPEEPQSYRDLALVLEKLEEYEKAIDLLYQVVLKDWDRFAEIELIALMELNHIIPKAKQAGITNFNVDKRLIKLLDLDVRIVMTWDEDMTDMDLWVIEPSGEKAFYGNNRTHIGGLVSRDFTLGYGPEEYLLKKAMKGKYKVQANYYGNNSPALTGHVTLQLNIYSNYGRGDEKHKSITLRLENRKEIIDVGEIEF